MRTVLDSSVDGASRRRVRLACKMTAATAVKAVKIFESKAETAGPRPSQGWSDLDLQNAKWGLAQLLCLIFHGVLQAARAAGGV